jgi:hypothetical protein
VAGWGEPRSIVSAKNVTYEVRVAHASEPELLEQYAVELVRLDVEVLVTSGDAATRAAMRASSTIPIVFSGVSDPVGNGLVSSLSRPTGNVTGYATFGNEVRVKRIEALRELVPHVRILKPFSLCDPAVVHSHLEAGEFRGIVVERITRSASFPSVDAFFEPYEQDGGRLGQFFLQLDMQAQERVKERVREALEEATTDGNLSMDIGAFIAIGVA